MLKNLEGGRESLMLCALYMFVLVISIYSAANGGLSPDQARDAYFSSRIAGGLEFPLGGPVIYSTFQLGPLWFYLCALPITLGGGFTSVAIMTAVLSTLKVPLAFWVGKRWAGDRFAWMLVLAVFCSGWLWVPLKFLTHAALLETTIWLLFAALLVWWKSRSVRAFACVGLAAALCLHAHPAALLIAATACAVVVILGMRRNQWWGIFALFAGGILLFIPYLIEQALKGWNVFNSVNQYIDTSVQSNHLSGIFRLLSAAFINGHSYELQYVAEVPTAFVQLFVYLLAGLLAAAAIVGAFNQSKLDTAQRRIAALAVFSAAALVAQAFFLVLIRPITPLWMMYSLLPFSAIFFACTMTLIPDAGWPRRLRIIILILCAASVVVSGLGYLKDGYSSMLLPLDESSGMLDVKDRPVGGKRYNIAFYRLSAVDQIANTASQYGFAHGLAAMIVEEAIGGVRANRTLQSINMVPLLGGKELPITEISRNNSRSGTHIAAFTLDAWSSLGRTPTFILGNLGWVAPVQIVNPNTASVVAHPSSPREFLAKRILAPTDEFNLDFNAPCGRAIAITNIFRRYAPAPVVSAHISNNAVLPHYKDNAGYFFTSQECSGSDNIRWQLNIKGVREAIDVVVF